MDQGKETYAQKETEVYFAEREMWWCALGVNIGFEQGGKRERYERPVVIIKIQSPCMRGDATYGARQKGWCYFPLGEISGRKAAAILSQIRFIDRRRLINKIGTLPENTFSELKKAVAERIW